VDKEEWSRIGSRRLGPGTRRTRLETRDERRVGKKKGEAPRQVLLAATAGDSSEASTSVVQVGNLQI
jgi:hypothetical protein